MPQMAGGVCSAAHVLAHDKAYVDMGLSTIRPAHEGATPRIRPSTRTFYMGHCVCMGLFEKQEKRVRVHVYLNQEQRDDIQKIAQDNEVSAAEVHREALTIGLKELRNKLRPPAQAPRRYDQFGNPYDQFGNPVN